MNKFPSTIIVGQNEKLINDQINQFCLDLNHNFDQNNPDIFVINQDTGWGIDQVRKIKNWLSQKPFSHQSKIVIILDSQNLNTEAQNAILKNLEEPGDNNYFILTVNKISSLLKTVVSRCQTTKIVGTRHALSQTNKIIITGNLQKDLSLSETLGKNKEDILPLLQSQLVFFQQSLIENPNKQTIVLIEKIIKAINMINANVDPKSALDYTFLI